MTPATIWEKLSSNIIFSCFQSWLVYDFFLLWSNSCSHAFSSTVCSLLSQVSGCWLFWLALLHKSSHWSVVVYCNKICSVHIEYWPCMHIWGLQQKSGTYANIGYFWNKLGPINAGTLKINITYTVMMGKWCIPLYGFRYSSQQN